jgi:glycosyltransferase involved in cell wall biosynthesis
MKIVFLHAVGINPIAGGISRMTSVLSYALKKNGIEVFYLSMTKIEGVQYDEDQFFFPDSNNPLSKDNQDYLIQFVKNKKVDILVNQATTSSIYTNLSYCVKSIGVKVVSVIHNSILTPINNFSALNEIKIIDMKLSGLLPITRTKLFVSIIKKLYWFKYHRHFNRLQQKSDIVVLVSEKNIPEFLYMIKEVAAKNVISISNAFSLEEYHYIEEEKEKEIIWVGTPDFSIKRLDLALQIWKLIEIKNKDWHFTILGDSPYLDKAKNLANELNLSNVNFVGRKNPISFYKRAKLLCMTSTTESFGLVLIEAMHFGVIPFAFDSFPAASDIIENQNNGILIKSFDIQEYANKLSHFMNDKKGQSQFALNCIEKAKDYNIDNVIKSWVLLFNKLLDEKL